MNILTTLAVSAPLAIFGLFSGDSEEEKTKPEDTGKEVVVVDNKAPSWPQMKDGKDIQLDENMLRDNVMVVLDMSGSMREGTCSGSFSTKSAAAKATLKEWLTGLNKDSNLGLVAFVNGRTQVHVPLSIKNRDTFMSTVNDFYADGGTPLSEAVRMAHEELEEQAVEQKGYGQYKMVVITDGQHSSGYNPDKEVQKILSNPQNPIEIHTIGFCIEDSALNQPGRIKYQSAKNPEELKKGLDSVLSEAKEFKGTDNFGEW